MKVTIRATISCPYCGHKHQEAMPSDHCLYFYRCTACDKTLKPKKGDCCVFCSYADHPCPPKQTERPI
ncbi:MAG TPA: hypothetical protein DCG46_00090 [Gammaproteobacteria bacterium]|nr:hypothetical protein [Gammaproteobacteria bacterium]HAE04835.1 hypothetical protein [Gammaproteobacteria bacterium]HAE69987.1 hypothetical protein [Gammaproteobacteria bacterium]HAE73230.1 hypothetical protein [Gammaproteobacteria bacterium]HAG48232.1 hypothetical protein [Gammaproteobacteria bacterium]